jgi:hypothetical protein
MPPPTASRIGHGDEDDSALLRVAEQRAAHRLGEKG